MNENIRRQLTLFVAPKDAETIEQIRQKFNPIQSELINAHVTLCREDEIEDTELIMSNLSGLRQSILTIEFGELIRFDNGNGIMLPAKDGNRAFQDLRRLVLAGLPGNIRKQDAHITLMHPRNSTCNDIIFEEIKRIDLPKKLAFSRISLIEQRQNTRWEIIREFDLKQ